MGWLSAFFSRGDKDKQSERAMDEHGTAKGASSVASAALSKPMTLVERLALMAKEEPLFADMADEQMDAEANAIAQKDISKRNVEENCILAGFLLMQSKGVDQDKITQCIDLLLRHANQMYQVPMWNFYLGLAYFYSGQIHVALRYFNVAKEDVEFNLSSEKYLSVCITELQMPELNPNFLQGCSKCYEALTADLDQISTEIKSQFATDAGVGHELYRHVSEILGLAFGRTAFNLDVDKHTDTARIMLLPVGNIARALQMQFFIANYPALFNGKLIISLAREVNNDFTIKFKKSVIAHKDVKCYLAPAKQGQGYIVYMYIKELREYLNEDFFSAYKMHLDLFYSAIGELAAACNHITFEALLKNEIPKDSDGQSFTLDRLYNKLLEKGVALEGSNDDLLERSFASYENDFTPEPLPDFTDDHQDETTHSDHAKAQITSAAQQANRASSTAANSTLANESVDGRETDAAASTANAATAAATESTASAAASGSQDSNKAANGDTAEYNRPIYRRDIVKGYTRCYQLIKEYGEAEHRLCDELLERGTVAGFIALKKELFDGDTAKISFEAFTNQFRQSLNSGLNGMSIPLNTKSSAGSDNASKLDNTPMGVIGIFAGAAEGLTCYYLDFMCWDTNTLLERTFEILKPLNCYELTYGTFRGDVAPLSLVKRAV